MLEKKKTPRPILRPLEENGDLFVFENLERNPNSGKDVLNEIIAETAKFSVFGNGKTIDQKMQLIKKE